MKIERKSTSQLIVDKILEQIENGELVCGDKLPPEREMAEMYGVSRVPLREAICALSIMGIIESRQGGGNYITGFKPGVLGRILRTYSMLDHSFFEELFVARREIEAIAARLAARNIEPEEIGKLREAKAQFHEAVEDITHGKYEYEKMNEADDMFHLGIAAASHNSFYIEFVALLHRAGYSHEDVRRTYETHKEYYKKADEFHGKILEAIVAGDEEKSYELMAGHIDDIFADVSENQAKYSNLEIDIKI